MIRREDLEGMRPETIELLRRHGDLDHLDDPGPTGEHKLSREDLQNMTPAEVHAARKSGHLDHLLKPQAPEAQAPQAPAGNADQGSRGTQPKVGRERLKGMTAEQIVAARQAGELDDLLNGG